MNEIIKVKKNNKIKIFLIAFLITFGLSLSLNIVKNADAGITKNMSPIVKCLIKIEESIKVDTLKFIIIFMLSCFLLNEQGRQEKDKRKNIIENILAILFALFTIIGYSYKKTNTWDLIFHGEIQFAKSLIVFISYSILFKLIIDYIFEKIITNIKYKSATNKIFNFIFEKHAFIMPLIIILVCWLPYVIIFYPGVLMKDSTNQIKQFFGMEIPEGSSNNSVNLIDENVKITNHHPVLHTVILGSCVKIGKIIGNDNLGIFLYTIIQTILLASALAYIIKFMKELKTNNYIRILALLIFCFIPVFPFYAVEITKDVPFASLMIFYIIELYKIIKEYADKKLSKKRVVLIIFISLMVCLLRNNGIYVILLSLPFAAISNKINRKSILFATLIVFILYESFIKLLLPALKISNTGVREMLSVPFQQTARYVKEYDNEVTDEEREIIDKVLKYDTLANRYVPERSDAVKDEYNKDATSEDLKNYFKVWFRQFFKHPNVYVEAFLNNYYGYFYLEGNIEEYTTRFIANCDDDLTKTGEFNYSYNDEYKGERNAVKHLLNISKRMPVIYWCTNIGLNTWILLIVLGYLIYKKKYKFIVFLLPSLVTLLVCCVSPVNAYFRYELPNIFAMPLIISIFVDIIRDKEVEL